jgi:hypothetical protein
MLSNVAIKYQLPSSLSATDQYKFYQDFKSNNIVKFDVFYDSFYIQTSSGYVFEKVVFDNYELYPYTEFNYFNSNNSTYVDYWFDENEKNVYICDFIDSKYNTISSINLNLIFNKFNISNGSTTNVLDVTAKIILLSAKNVYYYKTTREDPKLTYNSDTNTFNVSFLLKNDINQFGIVSINLKKGKNIQIDRINANIPFATVDIQSSYLF